MTVQEQKGTADIEMSLRGIPAERHHLILAKYANSPQIRLSIKGEVLFAHINTNGIVGIVRERIIRMAKLRIDESVEREKKAVLIELELINSR